MSRSVSVDGEKLARLRRAMGWRVSDLAENAKCSEKTVQNAEAGKPIYISSAAAIAKALRIEYEDLLVGGEPNLHRVRITVDADIRQLDSSKNVQILIRLLAELTGAKGIEIVKREEGSIIITLEMPEDDLLKVVAAFPRFRKWAAERVQDDIDRYERMPSYETPEASKTRARVDELKSLKRFVEGVQRLCIESE